VRLGPGGRGGAAFTLVEVLVGCAILVLLLVMLFSMTSQTTAIVSHASARVDAFQGARTAFDTISQRLSQATMNSYWDYYNSSNQRLSPTATSGSTAFGNFVPVTYGRASDLHFLIETNTYFGQSVFFEAPMAVSGTSTGFDQTQGLLNAIGYYVQFGSDAGFRPGLVSRQRYRYRLMQAIQPTENFQVYTSGTTSAWVTGTNGSTGVIGAAWPLVDNVIALIVWPRSNVQDPNGTLLLTNNQYNYDSRTPPAPSPAPLPIQYAQAPPEVQLTMIAIDEASATRLDPGTGAQPAVISSVLQSKNTAGENLFTDVTQYQGDLNLVTNALSAARINYQVLSNMVSLRESKWSEQ
jgi:uncharacterized protein (TIGR02599 family)